MASVLSFGTAAALFWVYSLQFEHLRQARTNFAFSLGPGSLWCPVLWVLVGCAAIDEGKWFFPVVLGALVSLILVPGYAWSGPGDLLRAIMPLIQMRTVIFELAVMVNAVLIALAVMRSKRLGSGIPSASVQPA